MTYLSPTATTAALVLSIALPLSPGQREANSALKSIPVAPGPAFAGAREPQVAVAPGGRIYVVFGKENAIYCAVSSDGGKSYDAPSLVASVDHLSLGMRRGPRVTVAGKSVVVTAISGPQGGGKDGDLLAWYSQDDGKTWRGPVRVNDAPDAAREGLHAMTASSDGTVACTWLDLRNKGTQLYASVSRAGGRTWGRNVRVYASPGGTICECCHPSIAFDPKGKLYVMWRNSLNGARDMYLTASSDGGKTFHPAQKLGTGTWMLNACPMDGGAIAISSLGVVTTFWRRDGEMFVCQPGKAEKSLGVGRQGWVATSADVPYFVWLKGREGAVAAVPGSPSVYPLDTAALNPVVAAPIRGTGPVVAAWTGRDGIESAVLSR